MRRLIIAGLCFASMHARADDRVVMENPFGSGIFYTSNVREGQIVQTQGVKEVVVRCFCPNSSIVRDLDAGELRIDFRAQYSIAGYHGTREEAGARPIPKGALKFQSSRVADTLFLDSPEWQYIHHSLIVTQLKIHISPTIAFKLEALSYEQLEERARSKVQ